VVVEEPLEIRLEHGPHAARESRSVSVTMRTPGHDFELAAGFLHGEGILESVSALLDITYCQDEGPQEYNVVRVRLAAGTVPALDRLERNFYTSSACGVCGKASLESVEIMGCAPLQAGTPSIEPAVLASLPDRLREHQGVFAKTGGLHAAGLFDPGGNLLVAREDVGRHNAVDKVVGERLLARRLPAGDGILVVSGRVSFEIVQKAVMAGIPALVAVGAPSSLAIDLAERFGMTLVGFARGEGFNLYTDAGRVRQPGVS
jgi:FdhD protein